MATIQPTTRCALRLGTRRATAVIAQPDTRYSQVSDTRGAVTPASKSDGRSARWDAHRLARRAELVRAHGGLRRTARRRRSGWIRSPPSPAPPRRCSTGTSPTRPTCTGRSASSWPARLGDQLSAADRQQTRSARDGPGRHRRLPGRARQATRAVPVRGPQPGGAAAGVDPVADYTGQIAARLDELIGRAARHRRSGAAPALGHRHRRPGQGGRRLVAGPSRTR